MTSSGADGSMTAPGDRTLTGGCLCGAVRFEAVALGARVFDVCHCAMCRRWAGGPWFGVETASVRFADETVLLKYRSSDWAERWSCARCGGALAYVLVDDGQIAVSLGALDDATGFTFEKEIFVDEQPPVYQFAGDAPRLTGPEVIAAYLAAKQASADDAQGKSDG